MGPPLVKLGPVVVPEKTLSPMMKEISSRKHNLDMVFKCDNGGVILAHKFFMAAQSKYLKSLLKTVGKAEVEMVEVNLPGVETRHMKKAVKFMYTGKLLISSAEIHTDHLVWHINNILVNILKIDAKLNLPPKLLVAPPSEEDEDDGNDENDETGNKNTQKESDRIFLSRTFRDHNGNPGPSSGSSSACDVDNTRQNTVGFEAKPLEEEVDKPRAQSIKFEAVDENIGEMERNVATPDIIDLLDSDSEDEDDDDREFINEATVPETKISESEYYDPMTIPTQPLPIHEGESSPTVTTGDRETMKRPHESGEILASDENNAEPLPDSPDTDEVSPPKRRCKDVLESDNVLTEDILQSAMAAVMIPSGDASSALPPVVARKSAPPPSDSAQPSTTAPPLATLNNSSNNNSNSKEKGVRAHHHIPWTVTGLKRPDTVADIQEQRGVHECRVCGAKFDKFKSLKIHMGRIHNKKAQVACPEGCGKLLTTQHAVKKHLLSHRPEQEWPHECPLCRKRFQARGDIPKHLKTKLHEHDNVPEMGSKEWFDLIYHDDPKYSYQETLAKLEKAKAKGMRSASSGSSEIVSYPVISLPWPPPPSH